MKPDEQEQLLAKYRSLDELDEQDHRAALRRGETKKKRIPRLSKDGRTPNPFAGFVEDAPCTYGKVNEIVRDCFKAYSAGIAELIPEAIAEAEKRVMQTASGKFASVAPVVDMASDIGKLKQQQSATSKHIQALERKFGGRS